MNNVSCKYAKDTALHDKTMSRGSRAWQTKIREALNIVLQKWCIQEWPPIKDDLWLLEIRPIELDAGVRRSLLEVSAENPEFLTHSIFLWARTFRGFPKEKDIIDALARVKISLAHPPRAGYVAYAAGGGVRGIYPTRYFHNIQQVLQLLQRRMKAQNMLARNHLLTEALIPLIALPLLTKVLIRFHLAPLFPKHKWIGYPP